MMKSIDNLREWANGLHGVYINQVDHTITITTGWDAPPDMDSVSLRDHVNGILDDIEREIKELTDERDLLKRQWEAGVDFDQRLESCADKREDVTLFGVDYTPLPVDADGVPINVGDVMDEQLPFGGYAAPAPVDTMELSRGAGGYGWMVRLDSESGAFINPKLLRHHHAPTVEDVLREFVERLDEIGSEDDCVGEAEQECRACIRRDVAAAYSEYAAKLMLKED